MREDNGSLGWIWEKRIRRLQKREHEQAIDFGPHGKGFARVKRL
jgi:hypothetical protein